MTWKTKKDVLILLLVCAVVFGISLFLGFYLNSRFEDDALCNSCHEMQPYFDPLKKPLNGSLIYTHDLNCIQCHSNKSIYNAKKTIVEKMILYRLNVSLFRNNFSDLKVDCMKCHVLPDTEIHRENATRCTDCHWAHRSSKGRANAVVASNGIPDAPHLSQPCKNCHGTSFEIPRCIKCHAGHGEVKLENTLCLACHKDPHAPVIPNNTVTFGENIPFSACKPCHENQYIELLYSLSMHADMGTCVKCHTKHGEKPGCRECHPGMMIQRHPEYFKCDTCHASFNPVKITCQDCHGRKHDWGHLTAILNPK